MEKTFKTKEFTLCLNRTYIMGILNITPDSFSDGGRYLDESNAISHGYDMVKKGADIIDVGGQSTRPGHTRISEEEEWERIEIVIRSLRRSVDVPISIDTFYPSVAEEAISNGADIINDVSGFSSKEMFKIAKRTLCGCIIMNNRSLNESHEFFADALKLIADYNLSESKICFDPGVGFGKTYFDDLKILGNVSKYCPNNFPVLIGASRKRVIGMACNNPDFLKRIPGTISAHIVSIMTGANIIRVHDVEEAVQAARVADAIIKNMEE